LVLGAGASFVLDALIEAICDPGDGVLIATPYWSGLDLSIEIRNRATVVPVNVPLADFFGPTSIALYEDALRKATVPVKAILITNPHNPLGRCYPASNLKQLVEFVKRHGLHMISDEVYALSKHKDTRRQQDAFTSALSVDAASKLVHVIYSVSKDFGCNGLRLGALASRHEEVRLCVSLSTHGQVSSLVVPFVESVLFREETMAALLTHNRRQLAEARRCVESFCRRRQIDYIRADAGMFVFARLLPQASAVEEETVFQKRLRMHGVSLTSGSACRCSERGWFRICFAVKPATLRKALRRIATAVTCPH
jgi:aspartate/methionine/tyrosine aminotransferase